MEGKTALRFVTITGGVVAIAFGAAACGSSSNNSKGTTTAASGGFSGKRVALLLPETKTTRYDQQDKPLFEKKLKALCPDCTLDYQNADQDATKQATQAEAEIAKGANVIVLDPVDGVAAASIVTKAKAANIPVVSYDRLVQGGQPDLYISYDNEQVGKLQGEALAAKLKADGNPTGPIVKINGSPTDNNATLFKKGSDAALQAAGVKILVQYDTPDWSPDKAQTFMEQQITKFGKTGFKGVYAANDGTGGGAIAAMKGAGIDVKTIPTTGQDAELAAIQRILAGEQFMTVYKAIKPEAEKAAQAALELASGQPLTGTTGTVNNTVKDVPSIILTPVSVTKANVASTVVADGFYTAAQLCTAAFASACANAGIAATK
ncbi:MAG: sugar ABC transporter substrate-binding protein [Actinobacteria bacterium]|nr:sugar ABC transporter substrate-binding protein [Actinomycetota bacterium]